MPLNHFGVSLPMLAPLTEADEVLVNRPLSRNVF